MNKNTVPLIFGSAVALMIFALSPGDSVVHKASDTLFIFGMLLISLGLIRFIQRLGFGRIFAFSWGRMRHVLRSDKSGETGVFPTTYYEYISSTKPKQQPVSFLLIFGFVLVLASLILALAV